MQYFDKDAILAALTKEQVIKIVLDLGSEGYKEDSQGNLIFQTICHGGDSYKLYYYHEPYGDYPGRVFHCYTRCSESFSIYELVIRAKRAQGKTITWYQAVSYVASMSNNITIEHKEEKVHTCDISWLKKFGKTRDNSITDCPEIDEHVLEMFEYTPHEIFLEDHISRETLSLFEISYWGNTNQIVIPHRDRNQKLIGIRGRYLDEEDVATIGKYVPLNIEGKFLSHRLSNNLYGIHVNQNKIKACKKCLLLESEKGVMQNHTYFGSDDFSLAVCGSEISDQQVRLLLDYLQIEELILGFDKEYREFDGWDGEVYRNKLFKKIKPIVPYCKVSILWDTQDLLDYKDAPTDKGKDTLLKLLDQKIEITMDDIYSMNEGVDYE